jgi:DNA-binding MarR family transcriptional regulator
MTSSSRSRAERKPGTKRAEAVKVLETQLSVLVRLLDHHSRRAITYKEMDRASYLISRVLDTAAPVSVHNLAKILSLEPTTVTRKIASMESEGFITRSVSDADKRVSLIQLSSLGRRKMEGVRRLRQQHNEKLTNDWPLEDLEKFGELMRKYNDCINEGPTIPSD